VGRLRLPSQIRVTDPSGGETLVRVVGVERAPGLGNDPELTPARLEQPGRHGGVGRMDLRSLASG
jgi:hypothetical protein